MKHIKSLHRQDKKVFRWPKTDNLFKQINFGVDDLYGVDTSVLERREIRAK